MEPVTDADEEQVPEDLGKLTVVDKARTGRVRNSNLLLCLNMFKAFNFEGWTNKYINTNTAPWFAFSFAVNILLNNFWLK